MMTEGEYRVTPANNLTAGQEAQVVAVRERVAELIDIMFLISDDRSHPGARCASIAMTEFESAAHWAVKAITKPTRD